MDFLAHYLWSYAIYFSRKRAALIALVGVAPDAISFGPHLVYSLLSTGLQLGPPANIPDYVHVLYQLTHSLVIFLAAAGIAYAVTRRFPWILGPWGIHILIDIPTHTEAFFPTPFLWPLSSYTVSGISWAAPWFMVANYAALLAAFSYLVGRRYAQRKASL
ncbi:MAG TPA: hypothetical protein VJC16_01380 [Candidatus Nanoarchaeia archaeon]|nr:hypothetical protein [Candidatus Nanoarchaeia archaeon]